MSAFGASEPFGEVELKGGSPAQLRRLATAAHMGMFEVKGQV
jgi:hypothetical protein